MPIHTAETHVEKTLSTRERGEPEAVLRLRSEAVLLGLLSSTGITPRLLAQGEDARGPWHRLERVTLPTFAEHLTAANGKPLDEAWIERTAEAAFRGLDVLHRAA